MRKIKKGLLTAVMTLLMGVTFAFSVACGEENVTVSFNTGDGDAIASVELNEGKAYTLPTPTYEGYSFEGWYTNAEFTGDPVTDIVASKNVTYYAKWEKMYLVTLDLNGGELDVTSLYLKVGENVYDAVSELVPTKGELVFGAWFDGEEELGTNTRMTEEGIELKAEYKIKYVVECYEQKLSLDGYDKSETTYEEYAYVGDTVSAEYTLTGFEEIDHDNTVRELVITETESDNVLKLYFDREEYEVVFHSNAPDGSTDTKTYEVVYGQEIEPPYDYTANGYCLLGWASSKNGELEYEANYIDKMLQNAQASETKKIKPTRDMALYGVWLEAYVDMFGNDDYLYLVEEEVTVGETTVTAYHVYLSRGDVYFEGKYDAEDKYFSFKSNNKTIAEGWIKDGRKFIYKNSDRADVLCTKFIFGAGLDVAEKIKFDSENGITYIQTGDDNIDKKAYGTYYINDEGYYVAKFVATEDTTLTELNDKTLTMTVGYVPDYATNSYISAFQVRNDNEVEMGSLVRFGFDQSGQLAYFIDENRKPIYDLSLDGFGTANFHLGGGEYESYFYILDDDGETLYLYERQQGQLIMTMKIFYEEQYEKLGYMQYNKDLVGSFGFGDGVMKLDGICKATYETESGTASGYYTSSASALGGTIVDIRIGGNTYKMIVTITQTQVGEMIMTTTSVEEKTSSYAEYYYMDESGLYYAPMLTINNEKVGDAYLYGYTQARTYEKVSEGTYTYDSKTGLYTYTMKDTFDAPNVSTTIVDLSTVKTIVFAVDSTVASVSVHYWYSYSSVDGTNSDPSDKTYTSADGTKSLLLVSGMGIYKENGAIIASGTYSTSESTGVTTLAAADGYYYFELTETIEGDETTRTLVKLDHAPYTLKWLMENGIDISPLETLSFDGKGGVVYTVTTKSTEQNVPDTVVKYTGKYEKTDVTTAQGYYVFRFSSEATADLAAQSFEFIIISDHSVFAKYNTKYNGVYQSEEDGKLELDGFGYLATWTDTEGNTYTNKYFIDKDNEIKLSVGDNGAFVYFDLKENRAFSFRGLENGTYLYVSNQLIDEMLFRFDGYGNLEVIEIVEDPENEGKTKENILGKGTYEFDEEWITITYKLTGDNQPYVLYGQLGYYYLDSTAFNAFFEYTEEVVKTYVNAADYTVVKLDGFGNATVHGKYGIVEYGYYTLVTDSLLYYVNASNTDARLYTYNATKGTIAPVSLKARGYYTENLESLLFTQYGFAIFNGQTRYYYYINDNNEVTIYREATDSDTKVNKYGFVEEVFGKYSATKVYGGKTYYASEKNALSFERKADNATKYPYKGQPLTKLTFAPTGDGSFTAVGGITFGEGESATSKQCTVVRKVLEDNSVEFYVLVDSFYRFDIAVDYKGDMDESVVNTYEIKSMSKVISTPSNFYLSMRGFYMLMGAADMAAELENAYGDINLVATYNEQGEETGFSFAGSFYNKSAMYDVDGNIISEWSGMPIYDVQTDAIIDSIEKIQLKANKLYKATKTVGDYKYHLYFTFSENQFLTGAYGYDVYALTREEVLTTEDKAYKVSIERVITSDRSAMKAGTLFNITLCTGEQGGDSAWLYTEVEGGEAWYERDGYLYFIVRTRNEETKLIESSTYYKLELEQELDETVEGEGATTNKNPVKVYTAFKSVAVEAVNTLYAVGDDKSFIDINTVTGKAMILNLDGAGYIVIDSTYDETTKTYTVKLSEKLSYTVKVEESGRVTIMEIVATEENA